jgi:hypothetical protein
MPKYGLLRRERRLVNIYISKGTEKQISNANKIEGDRFYLMNAQQIHTADRFAPADVIVMITHD